jgi:hypothetical protein
MPWRATQIRAIPTTQSLMNPNAATRIAAKGVIARYERSNRRPQGHNKGAV